MNQSILFLDQISGSRGCLFPPHLFKFGQNLNITIHDSQSLWGLCQTDWQTWPTTPHVLQLPQPIPAFFNNDYFLIYTQSINSNQITDQYSTSEPKIIQTLLSFYLSKFVSMEVLDHDDIFFADLNKQISLLIMEDDDDIHLPVSGYPHPSASFQVHTIFSVFYFSYILTSCMR